MPVALVGTGAAFIVGFKNMQTYNRMWEARIIWGGIATPAVPGVISMVKDFVRSANRQEALQFHRTLIYRHIAGGGGGGGGAPPPHGSLRFSCANRGAGRM